MIVLFLTFYIWYFDIKSLFVILVFIKFYFYYFIVVIIILMFILDL